MSAAAIPDGYILLPWSPMSKSSTNKIVEPKRGRAFMAKTKEYTDWQGWVKQWLAGQRFPKADRYRLDYIYVVPTLHHRDLDNAIAGVLDCMTGTALNDDSQVFELHGYKQHDPSLRECRLYLKLSALVPPSTE